MTADRFAAITDRYPGLRVGVVGDVCLDRYLEVDPGRAETSIETGLPVHNVSRVRSQPGAAGTILANLVALGVGEIVPVSFRGDDGEGYELERALRGLPGVNLDLFVRTPLRHTFTYCKPLVVEAGRPPRELSRLDTKNWTPTPPELQHALAASVAALAGRVDALIVLDQVDVPDTGVVTPPVAEAASAAARARPGLVVLADSRRGVAHLPPMGFKMNAAELGALTGGRPAGELADVLTSAAGATRRTGRPVFVTLAERGMVGALPGGPPAHAPAHPVRGPIDVVGAGDAVTANLAAALAAGATLAEAMDLAMAAASLVVHQVGTTGTATVRAIADLLAAGPESG